MNDVSERESQVLPNDKIHYKVDKKSELQISDKFINAHSNT